MQKIPHLCCTHKLKTLQVKTAVVKTMLCGAGLKYRFLNPIPTSKKSYIKDLPWAESAHA